MMFYYPDFMNVIVTTNLSGKRALDQSSMQHCWIRRLGIAGGKS
jgi:hypothetical protein